MSIDDGLAPPEIAQAIAGGDGDWRTRATLRAAVRRSLYAFTKIITCYNEIPNLLDPGVFKDSSDWLQHVVERDKRGLFEDPRGHVKSTRSTDSIPNWIACLTPDSTHDFPEEVTRATQYLLDHPHLRGVDSRIVIGSDSKERATIFTGVSRDHWMLNPVLRWAFPERLWENVNVREGSLGWSEGSWTPRGRKNLLIRDDFVRAIGLESKEQGGRAEVIVLDDLVGEQSWRSAPEIDRRKSWLRTIGNLLENADYRHPQGGVLLVVENRWSLDDVNTMIHETMFDWQVWRRSAYKCIVHGTGNCGRWGIDEQTTLVTQETPAGTTIDVDATVVEPVVACADSDVPLWESRYPDAESLERVRRDKGDEIFDAQWRNDPQRNVELKPSMFRDFHLAVESVVDPDDGTRRRMWCVVIASTDGRTPAEIIPLTALTAHVISMDPASSKESTAARTAVSWFALDRPTGRVFWLDCEGDRWGADLSIEHTYAMWCSAGDKLGREPGILVEKVAAQTYVAAALRFRHRLEESHRSSRRLPEVEMIPPAHGEAKNDRIKRRVGWRLSQGLLYLRSGLQLPRWETRHFPTGTKDALDTAVQAEERFLTMVRAGGNRDALDSRRRRRRMRAHGAGSAGVGL